MRKRKNKDRTFVFLTVMTHIFINMDKSHFPVEPQHFLPRLTFVYKMLVIFGTGVFLACAVVLYAFVHNAGIASGEPFHESVPENCDRLRNSHHTVVELPGKNGSGPLLFLEKLQRLANSEGLVAREFSPKTGICYRM